MLIMSIYASAAQPNVFEVTNQVSDDKNKNKKKREKCQFQAS